MVLAMARPIRRPDSRFPQARKVVPVELRAILGRTEFKRSLRGATLAEIKDQHRVLLDQWEAEIAAARAQQRGDLRHLSNRDVWALAGERYRDQVALYEADPGSPEGWEITAEVLIDRLDDNRPADSRRSERLEIDPNRKEITEAEELLRSRSIAATPDSVRRLAAALWETNVHHAQLMERRARGDYGADPHAARFPSPAEPPPPEVVSPPTEAPPPVPTLTFDALMTARQAERGLAESTVNRYGSALRAVVRVMGFDDVRRITVADVRQFKTKRLAEVRQFKTKRPCYLQCVAQLLLGQRAQCKHGLA